MNDDELLEQLRTALDDAPVAPPADRLARFRAEVETERARATRPVVVAIPEARRRMPSFRWAAAAALLLVAGGLGWALASSGDGTDEIAGDVEFDGDLVDPAGATRGEVTVTAIGIGRVIDLRTDALPILPTGEYYEMWFVGPGDSASDPNRISAGTFHPDTEGRSDVQFAAAVDPARYPLMEITAEIGDGDHAPSGVIVLTADLASRGPAGPNG